MIGYHSVGYEIAKVHKSLRAKFQRVLSPYDVTVQQFEVMRTLRTNPEITAAQLVEHIVSDSSTMMVILRRLESKALVARKPDKNDLRTKRILLTPKGTKLVKKLMDLAEQYNRQVHDALSSKELQAIQKYLSKLYAFSQSGEETAAVPGS